jgi:predicted GIY-YIG superfamily endonuclease
MVNKKRDNVTYELKRGNKVVYVGTTNDPERREQEHKKYGKEFGHMNITSVKITEETANKREKERLDTYRKNHGGNNPEYNKNDNG